MRGIDHSMETPDMVQQGGVSPLRQRSLMTLVALTVWLLSTFSLASSQHLPTTQWQQIELEHFVVIFEAGHEVEAQRVAGYLDYYLPQMEETLSLQRRGGKIPVVLSSSSHESNGYVGLMPRRSYFYNKPASFAGSEWLRTLAIHEGRHTQQFSKVLDTNTGFGLSILFGEMGTGAFGGLLYPGWYLEGDAVLEETLWTQGGRGRMASFDLWRRTHALSGAHDGFYRAYFGNDRDPYPYASHYDLGYFLVTYFRRTYGDDFFDQVLNRTGNRLFPLTFTGQIEALTGKTLPEHHAIAMDELLSTWQAQQNAMQITSVRALPRAESEHWLGYYPIASWGDTTWALKRGVQQDSRLVTLDANKETTVQAMPADLVSSYLSAMREQTVSQGGDRICWIREHAHARFQLQSWGDLSCLDLNTGNQVDLSQGRKYTHVAVSQENSRIAAVEFTADRKVSVDILNRQGDLLYRWDLPDNSYPFDVKWNEQGTGLLYAQLDEQGFSINWLNAARGEQQVLIEPTHEEALRGPVFAGRWVLYTSDYTGVDQIWALDSATGERFLAVQRPYGAYYPQWNPVRQEVIFSDYSPQGDRLMAYHLPGQVAPSHWVPMADVQPMRTEYFAPLMNDRYRAASERTDASFDAEEYVITDYDRTRNLLRPHSWAFGYANDELSANIRSDNVLDTLSVEASARYHFDAEQASAALMIENRRWYPVLSATMATDYQRELEDDKVVEEARSQRITGGIALPLMWRDQTQYKTLTLSGDLSWLSLQSIDGAPAVDEYAGGVVRVGLRYGQQQAGAFWDEGARRALQTDVNWAQSIDSLSDFDSRVLYGGVRLGLPSVFPNHLFGLHLDLERQFGDDDVNLRTDRPVARGYSEALSRDQGGLVAADYRMHLATLDVPVWKLLYFKRLALQVNADYEFAERNDNWRSQSSLGTTVLMPTHLFSNLNIVLEPAVSAFYRIEDTDWRFQFSLSAGNF
ncbi:hypothetical protein NFC81_15470 [Salinispirillum sp. LH 10-3-1]|uniref:BamA/TamA family outer membrane protein n=1 Tax=Salinispirillum sp. LH 10-3-1 TaxID=2952525 RepID=A0AB38YG79_9GAMM